MSPNDFGTLCICAQRYSMGRRTYMPGLVQRIIKGCWLDLEPNDRFVLIRDLAEELRLEDKKPGWLGHACDVQGWKEFHPWMVEHEHDKRPTVRKLRKVRKAKKGKKV